MEFIIMDEQGAKMHATIRSKLVHVFKQQLNEGDAVMLRIIFLFLDVIGQVIESPDLDNYGGNGNQEKKKPLKLMDLEGTELNCMLWGDHADQFTEFLKSCDDVGLLIVVIQLGAMQVQNAFLGEVSVIVAIVILIQEEEGWWYLGCRNCNKKVVRVDEVLDPEDKDTSASIKGTNGYFFQDLSDVAVKDTNVPQLDLASVMDDNGTPFELFKSITSTPNNSGSTNKPNGDGMLGDEGSNTKRQLIEEMGEKN
ncbi:replication protein A 70 kDa DNA-binding subunit B [Tanacetum coccineum]